YNNPALFKVVKGLAEYVRLCHGSHYERRLYAGGYASLFYGVHHGKRVHYCGKHAHLVGRGAFHVRPLASAPKVAAAYDERNLYPHLFYGSYLIDDARYHSLVEAVPRRSRQRFARKFYEHSLIFGLHRI